MANEKSYLVSSGQVLLYSDGHVESRIHYFDETARASRLRTRRFPNKRWRRPWRR
jgi:hypothetical protein